MAGGQLHSGPLVLTITNSGGHRFCSAFSQEGTAKREAVPMTKRPALMKD